MTCKPQGLDPLVERVLAALSAHPEAGEIVLGGYLVLQHYADYRRSHDVHAWWRTRASVAAQSAIRSAMQQVAAEEGSELRERRFGDTFSFELSRGGKKYFSFQIAVRSVELEPPQVSAWPPILIESLHDNLGAKMNALVERGSPRDFADIRQAVAVGLVTVSECWELWARKNPGGLVETARQKVLLHLVALEGRRPLNSISEPASRQVAQATRDWFKREFLRLP